MKAAKKEKNTRKKTQKEIPPQWTKDSSGLFGAPKLIFPSGFRQVATEQQQQKNKKKNKENKTKSENHKIKSSWN